MEGSSNNPIGVFDSGVGGLSVLQEIRRALPAEDLLYVGDSGNAPYGDRPREFIESRSLAIVRFLVERKAKAIVVACNTATGVAIERLRAEFPLPIVGMEPAVKPAALSTKSGVIGVLATSRTLSSQKFSRLVDGFRKDVEILIQPCPGLVDQVEKGDLAGVETRALVERFVHPLLERGADRLVLGCTHYHFLRPVIEAVAGPDVVIVDPGPAISLELQRRLEKGSLLDARNRRGAERFWSSDSPQHARTMMGRLWGAAIDVESLDV